MTTRLTDAGHEVAVSTMIGKIAGKGMTFRSDKAANENWGPESVCFVADVDGFALPVRIEAVIGVKDYIRHQITIVEVTGDRFSDRKYALDVVVRGGEVSAGLFDRWLVTSPQVSDPEVFRFFQAIIEKAREAKSRNFTIPAM